jgi:molybdenum cofactor cytidylyltransferase
MISAIIMAAGKSVRMGENKLLLPFKESSIIEEFLKTFPYNIFDKVILVYSDNSIAKIAMKFPLKLVENKTNYKGNTIKLAQSELMDIKATMYFVADQPLLTIKTIKKLVSEFVKNSDKIIIPAVTNKTFNPVIFPLSTYNDLINLENNQSGKAILQKHNDKINYVYFDDEKEFMDIDEKKDYEALIKLR